MAFDRHVLELAEVVQLERPAFMQTAIETVIGAVGARLGLGVQRP